MAARRNITIIRGTDYTHVVTLKTRIAGVTAVLDITGRTYTAELRRVRSQDDPDVSMTVTVPLGSDGEIHLLLSHAETEAMRVGDYNWTLTQNASGIVSRVLDGKAHVVA